MASETVLELRHISKRFPAVVANDDVSLSVRPGEVLGLLGENGAGKSTLMNIISGLVLPDGGDILVGGRPVAFTSPREAIALGIGMVHQHFMLVPTLTVTENVVLGDARTPAGRIDFRELGRTIRALSEEVGLRVDPDAVVGDLDIGEQQRVELLKALYREARVLILDEPTSVLSVNECRHLYEVIRRLAARGMSSILISHRLEDIYAVCDRVAVMRAGKLVGQMPVNDGVPRERLVRMMVGSEIELQRSKSAATPASVILRVAGVSLRRANGAIVLSDVSFDLHAGEILALAGVEGNGQRELVEAVCGLTKPVVGTISHGFESHSKARTVRDLRRAGLGHIPADRHADGILGTLSVGENFLLTHFFAPRYNRFGWLRRGFANSTAGRLIEEFDIKAPGVRTPVGKLSGGNQQKLVLARELEHSPRILVAAHPTRGLDVRTIAYVHNRLLEQRDAGKGILLISSDLSDIWQIADRVMVAAGGRIRGPVPVAETDIHEVGKWMTA